MNLNRHLISPPLFRYLLTLWPAAAFAALLLIEGLTAQGAELDAIATTEAMDALADLSKAGIPSVRLHKVYVAGHRIQVDLGGELMALGVDSQAYRLVLDEITSRVGKRIYPEMFGDAPPDVAYQWLVDGVPLDQRLPRAEEDMGKSPKHDGRRPTLHGLSGRLIVLSPGHGYYYNGSTWVLQRDFYSGIVEDFINSDIVAELAKRLSEGGVEVRPTRELNKNAGNGESGKPRWQEAARYYLKSLGVSPNVWNEANFPKQLDQDIRCRPLYANSINADLLVSLHNNGGGGTGTEILYDTSNSSASESRRLAEILQRHLRGSIQTKYLSTWRDRGLVGSNGAKGENHHSMKPSVIIELAFMDTKSPDNDALQNANFRTIATQAIQSGLNEYFGSNDTADLTIVEPVVAAPSSVAPGAKIHVEWTEKNKGSAASPLTHNTKIFLSSAAYGTTHLLGYYGPMVTLGPGATKAYSDDLVVPASVPAGEYYVTAFIDCDSMLLEGNEGNNIGSSTPAKITVGGEPPSTRVISLTGDLVFGNVSVGTTEERNLTIANNGNSPLKVNSIAYPNGFRGDWTGTIAAGALQNVVVIFSPSAAVGYGGELTVNSDKTGGISTRAISGVGTGGIVVPTVATLDPTSITDSSVFLRGQVVNNGGAPIVERRIEWAKSSGDWGTGITGVDYGVISNGSITGPDNEFSATLSGLPANTGYKYRVYARNSAGFSIPNLVNVKNFTTLGATTRIISLSGDLSFGNVSVGTLTTRTLKISNTGNSALTVTSISYPNGFRGDWSGVISPGDAHDVVVTFSPTAAVGYGGELTVNSDKTGGISTRTLSGVGTERIVVPTVATLDPASITDSSAVLRGQVVNNGGAPIVERRIEWAKSSGNWGTGIQGVDYGVISDGSITGPDNEFSATLSGLPANTGYKYRVYARNSAGFSIPNLVDVKSFTTRGATTRIISLSGDLSFGSISVGTLTTRTLTIANTGDSALTVTSISYPNGFRGDWSGTIAAGALQNVVVTFAPTAAVGYGGELTVNSDKTGGISTRTLSGVGTERIVVPTVATLDPASITDSSAVLRGQVVNNGGAPIVERRIEWAKSSGNWGTGIQGVDYGVISDGSITGPDNEFSATLSGLPANTGYKYRVYARNSAGFSSASLVSEKSFITSGKLSQIGTVVAWGLNDKGQTNVPAGLRGVKSIAAGWLHSVALKSDGSVVTWGDNAFGEATVPVGLNEVTAIAAGYGHTVALKSNGTVVAWGDNSYGQSAVPAGLSGVTAIAAGLHTLALKSDGTVVAWGYSHFGQTIVPEGLSEVTAIAAGVLHSVALKSDGTVVAWGRKIEGQSTVPAGLTEVIAIAAGFYNTMALKADGTIVAWGRNDYGESSVPLGLSGVSSIAGGGYHPMALKGDGTVVAWGYNNSGQATIPDGLVGVRAVSAGGYHSLALVDYQPDGHLELVSIREGRVHFALHGKVDSKYFIQVSSDLINWTPLSTSIIAKGGVALLFDQLLENNLPKFYRAIPERVIAVPPIVSDSFDRPNSPNVGEFWNETDENNLLSIDSNSLRFSAGIDKSAYIRGDANTQHDLAIGFTLDIVLKNTNQVIQVGINAGGSRNEPPYRDCFGFAILPAYGVQPNDTGFQGVITPYSFDNGRVYNCEILIFQDTSRELRVWPFGDLRPFAPTVGAPAQKVLASGSKFHIGFDSGSGTSTEIRIDDFRIDRFQR